MVEAVAFVLKDGDGAEDSEAVSEASWNEELAVIVLGQFDGYVLAVCWGAFTDVDGYIEDSSFDAADKLGLSEGRVLEVKATHDAVGGAGFVVLDEVYFGYFFVEFLLVVGF